MSGNRLSGKVAIVTGSGQGAGMGAALAMAAEGASVVLFGRTLAKVETVAAQIRDRGGKAVAFGGDVTSKADLVASIDLALASFGRLDILVNAAQSPQIRYAKLLDISDAEIFDLWNSGAAATLNFMRLAHPHMVRAGGGSIVNFGSGAQYGPANYGVYAGVKSAIEKISRAASQEWARDNIRVNTVVPMSLSPAADADPGGGPAVLAAYVPLGRVGDPEKDIGRPIAFLASDDAAYITGTVMMLDGGLSYAG